MNKAHIKRYLGIPVIVQLRDAMALGHAGAVKPAPVTNADGAMLLRDGSVAPPDAKPEDVAIRPVWPISVLKEGDGRVVQLTPVFRYAVENAIISIPQEKQSSDLTAEFVGAELSGASGRDLELVLIHYHDAETRTLYELAVEPEAIVGITCVREGPMPEQQSRLVRPQN